MIRDPREIVPVARCEIIENGNRPVGQEMGDEVAPDKACPTRNEEFHKVGIVPQEVGLERSRKLGLSPLLSSGRLFRW